MAFDNVVAVFGDSVLGGWGGGWSGFGASRFPGSVDEGWALNPESLNPKP